MSRAEFLKELAKLKGRFEVDGQGLMRCRKGDCPISAVANARAKRRRYNSGEYEIAGERLGLSDCAGIADAADYFTEELRDTQPALARLRRDMLKVLGLKERAV